MLRRLLSLFLALCVFGGLVVAPTNAVALVCRMTGLPMAPLLRVAGEFGSRTPGAASRMPCCVVDARQDAAGGVRYALAERSCCDLRISAPRAHGPSFLAPEPLLLAAAIVPAVSVVTMPASSRESITAPPIAREAAPRAPPKRATCLRAPPVLS